MAYSQTDFAGATLIAQQALALAHDLADTWCRAFGLTTLAMVAMDQRDYRTATTLQDEALALYRESDDRWAIGVCLNNLGLLAGLQGDFARAGALLEESLALARRGDDRRATALVLVNLGALAYARGDLTRAQTLWTESLSLYRELGGTWIDEVAFEGVEGLAEIAAARGQSRRATRLLAAAEALRGSVAVPCPPHMQAAYDGAVAAARGFRRGSLHGGAGGRRGARVGAGHRRGSGPPAMTVARVMEQWGTARRRPRPHQTQR